jgi:hypothetical protein
MPQLKRAPRFRWSGTSIAVSTVIAVTLAAQAAAAATPAPVLARPRVAEAQPSASATGTLVWSQNSREHRRHYNAFAMVPGGHPVRVNERGTKSPQASIVGTSVLYARWADEDIDLRFYDVVTGKRTGPGKGINTRYLEYQPNVTRDYIFFQRGKFRGENRWVRLILYDRSTGRSKILAEGDPRQEYLDPDQVTGDWLTWESCDLIHHHLFSDCQVYLYRISTGTTVRLPNPRQQQYGAAVTSDGTVYFVRTGHRHYWLCGTHATIFRYPLGGPATEIASLPDGIDAFTAFALENGYGSTTLYFERDECGGPNRDIYKIEGAEGA